MKRGKFIILISILFYSLAIFLFNFKIEILAQNSSIFINVGSLLNFSPDLAIRGFFILESISGISIAMLGIGIEYFL